MSFPATILETILVRLAGLVLTGAGRDMAAARHAAVRMLCDYHPHAEDELCLAATIISFSFHALEALAQDQLTKPAAWRLPNANAC